MPARDLAPTRIALLELGEERAAAREGYALLDEKRMLLAARILALLKQHAAACARWTAALAEAEGALVAAYDRHGVRDLELRPRVQYAAPLAVREERLLGVRVPGVTVGEIKVTTSRETADESPEVRRAAAVYRALLAAAPALAALECALWRLADEYRRTERRAGAIEHLLLPELERDIAEIEGVLEAVDQEETQRVRRARAGR